MSLSLKDSNYESVSLGRSEVLFKKGEEASFLYILEFGHIGIFDVSNNKRIIPMFSKLDNGVIGEDCVLQDDPRYNYNAVALMPSKLIKIPTSEVHMFLSSSADWLEKILFELSGRIRNTSNLLIKHNIHDGRLNNNSEFSNEELAQLRSVIKG
jgi:CRP-like cAMP-binding protein